MHNGGNFYKSLNGGEGVVLQGDCVASQRMDVMDFFSRLSKFCASVPEEEGCPRCCFRFFCFRNIATWNFEMVETAVNYLTPLGDIETAPHKDK